MFIITSIVVLIFLLFYNLNMFLNCIIGCAGVGAVFLIIFFISKGGIGLGDMFYLIFFSSLFGYVFAAMAFLLSFWSAALVIIIPLFLKRINKQTKIPMMPFLFVGCVFALLVGYLFKFNILYSIR